MFVGCLPTLFSWVCFLGVCSLLRGFWPSWTSDSVESTRWRFEDPPLYLCPHRCCRYPLLCYQKHGYVSFLLFKMWNYCVPLNVEFYSSTSTQDYNQGMGGSCQPACTGDEAQPYYWCVVFCYSLDRWRWYVFKVFRRKITVEKDLFRPSRLLSYLIQSRALKPIHSFFFQVTTVTCPGVGHVG